MQIKCSVKRNKPDLQVNNSGSSLLIILHIVRIRGKYFWAWSTDETLGIVKIIKLDSSATVTTVKVKNWLT